MSAVRIVLGVLGAVMVAIGVALAVSGGLMESPIPIVWLIGSGTVLVIVAVVEVSRYRSEAAEKAGTPPGPGGGETDPIEPRFRPTDEVFVDPGTSHRMRVFADPATGERRYVAEG